MKKLLLSISYLHILQNSGTFYFSVITDIKKGKLKTFFLRLWPLNVFKMSHTLKRNLAKLVYVQKEKTLNLTFSYLSYFNVKNHEI